MSIKQAIPLEQAVELLLSATQGPSGQETVSLMDALGRVLSQDVMAEVDTPPFDRSPLDGYAVIHSDIQGASRHQPAILRVTQSIFAGDPPSAPLLQGQAARIMTGAPLPENATCVVRQEDTNGGTAQVHIYQPVEKHQNYCWKGEDIHRGQLLLRRGTCLDSAGLAGLAGQGKTAVTVFPKPRIGVVSTGSELVRPGTPLPPGGIYDSNRYYLAGRVSRLGGIAVPGGKAGDNPNLLADTIGALLEPCDMVVTTGGVSVGARDYLPAVSKLLGATELFHGVALKPGGPAMAFCADGKLVIALSGNPFAAAATFEVMARPAVHKLCGLRDVWLPKARGKLQDSLDKASPGRRLVRAKIQGDRIHLPQGGHASGIMTSMIGCNCLMDIPPGSPPLTAGQMVDVFLL